MTFSRIRPRVVAVLDLDIGLEQVDDREIGGGLAVGDRARSPAPASPGCDASG